MDMGNVFLKLKYSRAFHTKTHGKSVGNFFFQQTLIARSKEVKRWFEARFSDTSRSLERMRGADERLRAPLMIPMKFLFRQSPWVAKYNSGKFVNENYQRSISTEVMAYLTRTRGWNPQKDIFRLCSATLQLAKSICQNHRNWWLANKEDWYFKADVKLEFRCKKKGKVVAIWSY